MDLAPSLAAQPKTDRPLWGRVVHVPAREDDGDHADADHEPRVQADDADERLQYEAGVPEDDRDHEHHRRQRQGLQKQLGEQHDERARRLDARFSEDEESRRLGAQTAPA